MAGVTYNLDFILTVETHDHQIIQQTPDDKSRFTPGRSFYYDVKDLNLKKATLIGKGHILEVDLITGAANIDGRVLFPPKGTRPPEATDFKLLYYRQVQHDSTLKVDVKEDRNSLTGLRAFYERRSGYKPRVKYVVGWTTNYKGKNYKWQLGLT